MLLDFTTQFNWLRAGFFRQSASPPIPLPNQSCPLASPDAPLPAWVAPDPIVQQYRALIGDLPWASFPERPHDRPWPGPRSDSRARFVAAYLIKLHEGKRYMSDLRAFLLKHPALVWWLGFARVRDQSAPYGFDVAQTVPKRRHFSTVLRMTFFCPFCQPYDLANPPVREEAAQTLYTATVHTLEEARGFVLRVGLCGVLHDPKGKLPTLWDALDFAGEGQISGVRS